MVRSTSEEEFELRRGPWTVEEDSLLIDYITCHGEGRWNLLAQCSGLKRTGKSCRLRWLNYLKPDIKRGNLTTQEQLLILQLHSRWGNRWSKIAQHLPGRTDNEIKNYWRTRVQKQARHLKIESNSSKFMDAIRCVWIPRLQEQMEQTLSSSSTSSTTPFSNDHSISPKMEPGNSLVESLTTPHLQPPTESSSQEQPLSNGSSILCFSDYRTSSQLPEIAENQTSPARDSANTAYDSYYVDPSGYDVELNLDDTSAVGPRGSWFTDGQVAGNQWISDSMGGSLWSPDELWQF